MKRSDSAVRPFGRQAVGRPVKHTEPWSKITLTLQDRHAAYLDRVRVTVRLQRRKVVSRAELIRGLVELMTQSGIDFSQFASTREITEFLTQYFRGLGRRSAFVRPKRKPDEQDAEVAATG